MTHSLTLEVPANIYEPLAEEARAKGQTVENLALEMIELLTVERKLSAAESEHLADVLADEFEKRLPDDAKPLSEYLFTRESLYEDRI